MKRNKKKAIYKSNNKVKLVRGGKPYFDCLLELIASAREHIHLQTYIFDADETGRMIADALKEAVARKVRVYMIVDGYASKALPKAFINELKEAGIHFRFFDPIFKSHYFYFGRRLHHKITVADARYALTGGVNITNRYNDMPDAPAWLDFALHMEGEIVKDLCVLCWKTWYNYPMKMGRLPFEDKEIDYAFDKSETSEIAMRRNDWVRRKNEISGTYIQMLRTSKSHVTILCSYFLPGRVIRRMLTYASRKGIKIRVVTAGISDIKVAKYAERYMYGWLLRNNIELYEYQRSVLHGKIAVCDSEWMTIGSYNVNNISAYASIELNINVNDPAFAKETEKTIQEIIEKDCVQVTPDSYNSTRKPLHKLAQWMAYTFVRATFYLFTFYFKHQH